MIRFGLALLLVIVPNIWGRTQQHTTRIFAFSGEPLQLQWDAYARALLLTIQTENGIRHLHLTDSSAVPLSLAESPVYVAAHPLTKAYAGALSDGKPWTSGQYKFLSRFGQRKVFLQQPVFNPSGNLLAFSAQTPYKPEWRLMTYDLKYDNLNAMEGLPAEASYPAWSPRGTFIAMIVPSHHPARQQTAIVRWDATGLRYLSSDSLSFEYATWPGSEQYLLITTRGSKGWFILKQHLRRPNTDLLYQSNEELRFAIMIPDTGKIALLKRWGAGWELWILDPTYPLHSGVTD